MLTAKDIVSDVANIKLGWTTINAIKTNSNIHFLLVLMTAYFKHGDNRFIMDAGSRITIAETIMVSPVRMYEYIKVLTLLNILTLRAKNDYVLNIDKVDYILLDDEDTIIESNNLNQINN